MTPGPPDLGMRDETRLLYATRRQAVIEDATTADIRAVATARTKAAETSPPTTAKSVSTSTSPKSSTTSTVSKAPSTPTVSKTTVTTATKAPTTPSTAKAGYNRDFSRTFGIGRAVVSAAINSYQNCSCF